MNDYGILSGNRILEEIEKGNIVIEPFDLQRMNPNSYNIRLADDILTYDNAVLDVKSKNAYTIDKIPEGGMLLIPGKLYLARTVERTTTNGFVPMLEGRSSMGRLGLFIHATAGFGDNGFDGYWTLELSCVQPTIIYPNIEIGQLYYHTIADSKEEFGAHCIPIKYEHGKYQGNDGVQPSMSWKDFEND